MRRLGDLSELIGGRLTGSPDLEITGAASIARASFNDITFVTSAKHLDAFEDSDAAAAIVCQGMESSKPCIEVDAVESAFIEIAESFSAPIVREPVGISPQAIVSPSADVADDVCIYPGAVVMDNVRIGVGSVVFPNVTIMENCVVGANVQIFPGAVLYENTIVGDRAIIHAGVVLGAFGFGYKSGTGKHLLAAQLGNVVIEDDVEIGANTTIDRGTYDATVIGSGTKIDDLVMIGHNSVIGQHNLLCSQVGIAGSCTTGDYVVMGGQVGLADHLDIGSNVSIGAKSGLMHDVPAGQKFFGSPARPAREEMQILAVKAKLPELRKEIKRMSAKLDRLSPASEKSGDTKAA